ncbi:LuxR C-terminal-related transcriptional regulator [Streptomyces ipomoeae]|jgi:DNA-binding CsgD family transcriptional regulator|nr:LuxR C-terminal-related transcriptional regulator [Streptomyces ipomoeae]MDX2695398.1 LuxR C-terminal-related transcriptional regulator [Streptomyces ipomoeae]MDX2823212.1 LuxR C-terminal-related transcriptional regulator [Streptomyces ipomoeae]MDX2843504.1 LuxR C-terminal-related transcriptional regulator [Streptomyces ipomoeae]MDX2875817.1 LuxR C-terminal-related transcriptional regulator [Streptomyces ipomoeae]
MDETSLCAALVAPCFHIAATSENFARITGNAIESIKQLSFRDILRLNPGSRLTHHLDDLFQSKKEHIVERFVGATLDGSVNDIHVHVFAVEGNRVDGGRMALVIIRRQYGAPYSEKQVTLSRIAARIVEGIAMGDSSNQIASRLSMSRQGVEYHISGLLRKFDAPSRTALISRMFARQIFDETCWPPMVLPQYVK